MDEYVVEGRYGVGPGGWEIVTYEESVNDARQMCADYNRSVPNVQHRWRRAKKEEQ